ncbi:SdiA-regulated domain-containing protein [Methylophaga sp.]|uniref:SdiA-regulated domain-containing protein n=1 Tax=Methylophaga sp. TaxID=2024840 RepID=UPI00271D0133|nr:SdiA-regulated domain-containing protein [Methylophaga sp.]MDO8828023.1 SdiA-regulated domain-containing protein [Methylophaga sp.]
MSFFSNKTKSRLWITALLITTALSGCLWFSTVSSARTTLDSRWNLQQDYQFSKVLTIDGIDDNLSGLTYHPESGHLYGIVNNPEQIVVISKTGELLRTIDLIGFSDTESIDYVKDNIFIVGEERLQTISYIEILDSTTHINYQDVETIAISSPEKENTGLEGIAISQQHGLFVVREKPARILHFSLNNDNDTSQFDAMKNLRLDVGDFSGLTLLKDGTEQKLLVLSDESHSLHVIDLMGQQRSQLRLGRGPFNLWPVMQQPEGVTSDTDGNIYVVGEPNELLILTRNHNPNS